jgi:hypothetical protein
MSNFLNRNIQVIILYMLDFSSETGSGTKRKKIFTCPASAHLCYCTLSHPAPLFSSPNESAQREYYLPRKLVIKRKRSIFESLNIKFKSVLSAFALMVFKVF